jgi:hypothetical protein
MAFAHNGEIKAMYNHWDSYPTGLGDVMVKWMLAQDGDFSKAIEQFDRLTAVEEDSEPTEDQKLALVRYLDLGVGNKTDGDWYNLLRDTQGNPVGALEAGFFVDYFKFGEDSLFCEYAYVVDLDRKVLEVYKGFQNKPHGSGRWAQGASRTLDYGSRDTYYPIQLIREYGLEELQEYPGIMEALETQLESDEDEE